MTGPWPRRGLTLDGRAGGRAPLRARLALATAHVVLGAAGPHADRLRRELLEGADRWADDLRTDGRVTPVVRTGPGYAPGLMCPECSGPVALALNGDPDTLASAHCLDCG